MKKVFHVFCGRQRMQEGTFRFVYDGKRVKEGDTVMSLNMEEGDVIEAMV